MDVQGIRQLEPRGFSLPASNSAIGRLKGDCREPLSSLRGNLGGHCNICEPNSRHSMTIWRRMDRKRGLTTCEHSILCTQVVSIYCAHPPQRLFPPAPTISMLRINTHRRLPRLRSQRPEPCWCIFEGISFQHYCFKRSVAAQRAGRASFFMIFHSKCAGTLRPSVQASAMTPGLFPESQSWEIWTKQIRYQYAGMPCWRFDFSLHSCRLVPPRTRASPNPKETACLAASMHGKQNLWNVILCHSDA